MRQGTSKSVRMGVLLAAAIALPRAVRAEEPAAGSNLQVSASISPGGRWLVIAISELETSATDLIPELTIRRESGRKLYRLALSAKKPRVTLLEETQETPESDVRSIILNTLGLFTGAIVLDDGTALAVTRGRNLGRWNAAGKFSEQKLFKDTSFRQLSVVAGGKRLVASTRALGARQSITNQVIDLKTYQISEAPFLKGLAGELLQWTPDMKHVHGLELPATALSKETIAAPGAGQTGKLVRVSTQGAEKIIVATDVPYGSIRFGKNIIVYSGRGKDGAETFVRVKKADPPVVEAIPGLRTWTPVAALEEDRFLLRSGTERHGIVTFPAKGDDAARTPPVELLSLPPHDHILYSPHLKAFVLSKDGIAWKLVDTKGAELWQIELGPQAKAGR